MCDSMPSPGIWFVEHKPGVKSASNIMKICDLPEQWPLIHYVGYRDNISKNVCDMLDSGKTWNVYQLVDLVLKTIAEEHAEYARTEFPKKIINTIDDLK